MSQLGTHLRARREQLGLSLRQMALDCVYEDGTHLSWSMLAQVERGEVMLPRLRALAAFSRGYGLPLDYLARLWAASVAGPFSPVAAEDIEVAAVAAASGR